MDTLCSGICNRQTATVLILASRQGVCDDSWVTSGLTDDSFAERVNAVFGECGAFVRDTTLPDTVLAKYKVGVLLREPTYCDASHKLGGFIAPHRFLIFSSQARSLDELAPQPWGLCVWQRGRVFKVINRLTDDEHVQALSVKLA